MIKLVGKETFCCAVMKSQSEHAYSSDLLTLQVLISIFSSLSRGQNE